MNLEELRDCCYEGSYAVIKCEDYYVKPDGGDTIYNSNKDPFIWISEESYMYWYEHYDNNDLAYNPIVAVSKDDGRFIQMNEVEKYRNKVMLKDYVHNVREIIPTGDGYDFKYDVVDVSRRKLYNTMYENYLYYLVER